MNIYHEITRDTLCLWFWHNSGIVGRIIQAGATYPQVHPRMPLAGVEFPHFCPPTTQLIFGIMMKVMKEQIYLHLA